MKTEGSEDGRTPRSRPARFKIPAVNGRFEIARGHPLPLGATVSRGGINFSVFSKNATDVALVIFAGGDSAPVAELPLDPRCNKTGEIWHAFVRGMDPGIEYGFRVGGQNDAKATWHRFDPSKILVDPYARSLSGGEAWGGKGVDRTAPYLRRSRVVDEQFDWEYDQPLSRGLAGSVIYELHVRGFTRHPSSGAEHPGTFLGLTEKIPYLKELGVTAVELMPVTDFLETDSTVFDPGTGRRLLNFWGYHPISFFALKASYAASSGQGAELREFKSMVKAFHDAGIEVILDMVYNHTGEGDENGATVSFRGFDNAVYYIVEPETGRNLNFSGCGNTMNCNHPVVRDLILDSLRYLVTEMHVDGFRFDLASILGRGTDGGVLSNPPLLEHIAGEPVLANIKLIAEVWDAAGLYQVGSFPSWGRWAEWNARYRDDIRRFWKGSPDMVSALCTRLCGSEDLYRGSGRASYHSVNFVTSHDGFTLADLVSYDAKHNKANGEGNKDGLNENDSWNCGVEGPTSDPEILALRQRQMKNLAGTLLLSQGVPMILAGDEFGRTQKGNNNAYCQDNEISWLDWSGPVENKGLVRFFKNLIGFRKRHLLFSQHEFLGQESRQVPKVVWHGVQLHQPDWSWHSQSIAVELQFEGMDSDLYLVFNAYENDLTFELPSGAPGKRWHRFLDTSLDSPLDVAEEGREALVSDQSSFRVAGRSLVVLLQR